MSWRWFPPLLAATVALAFAGHAWKMRGHSASSDPMPGDDGRSEAGLASPPAAGEEPGSTADAEPNIALRAAPDGGAPLRGTLPADKTRVEVITRQGNWAEVQHGGMSGWVLRSEIGEKQP